ncbi:MAG: DUF4127 family protein [Lachnospiraceae bacterium]|nr:DUF4127 family protein [Lachnospiraceae bacterium]
MKKIVLLPLDERPCNYDFVYKLFQSDELKIVRPTQLGSKKDPADFDKIKEFLFEECEQAFGLILSVDMLLYGGLVPSRMHMETVETLKERLQVIKQLKEKNPQLKIYAFHCIMRCPSYNNADEEPDYYEYYGERLFTYGVMKHKVQLGQAAAEEAEVLRAQIPEKVLVDFEGRRELSRTLNMETVRYYTEGDLDALVFPQDDSAPLGYTAIDQMQIRRKIQEAGMTDEILLYSGADEVALTLTARMLNEMKGNHPKVYVKYATEAAKHMIPKYEGVRLCTTIGFHILSAGCIPVEQEEAADVIMIATAPDDKMEEAFDQPSISPNYNAERNMAEIMRYIREKLSEGKRVAIADNAYSNGGELDLIRMLNKHGILMDVSAYAGWNTNGNTLGTVLAEAVYDYYYGDTKQRKDFLVERYLEDVGYCSHARGLVTTEISAYADTAFATEENAAEVAASARVHLDEFTAQYLSSIADKVHITHVSMPWKRMFEVKLDAEYNQ